MRFFLGGAPPASLDAAFPRPGPAIFVDVLVSSDSVPRLCSQTLGAEADLKPGEVLYIDRNYFETLWTVVWDGRGNYWKEQFPFRTPAHLSDGQPILSIGTVVMTNVQNGDQRL